MKTQYIYFSLSQASNCGSGNKFQCFPFISISICLPPSIFLFQTPSGDRLLTFSTWEGIVGDASVFFSSCIFFVEETFFYTTFINRSLVCVLAQLGGCFRFSRPVCRGSSCKTRDWRRGKSDRLWICECDKVRCAFVTTLSRPA